MLPDWVLNPGPLTYESGALPIALRGMTVSIEKRCKKFLLRRDAKMKMVELLPPNIYSFTLRIERFKCNHEIKLM